MHNGAQTKTPRDRADAGLSASPFSPAAVESGVGALPPLPAVGDPLDLPPAAAPEGSRGFPPPSPGFRAAAGIPLTSIEFGDWCMDHAQPGDWLLIGFGRRGLLWRIVERLQERMLRDLHPALPAADARAAAAYVHAEIVDHRTWRSVAMTRPECQILVIDLRLQPGDRVIVRRPVVHADGPERDATLPEGLRIADAAHADLGLDYPEWEAFGYWVWSWAICKLAFGRTFRRVFDRADTDVCSARVWHWSTLAEIWPDLDLESAEAIPAGHYPAELVLNRRARTLGAFAIVPPADRQSAGGQNQQETRTMSQIPASSPRPWNTACRDALAILAIVALVALLAAALMSAASAFTLGLINIRKDVITTGQNFESDSKSAGNIGGAGHQIANLPDIGQGEAKLDAEGREIPGDPLNLAGFQSMTNNTATNTASLDTALEFLRADQSDVTRAGNDAAMSDTGDKNRAGPSLNAAATGQGIAAAQQTQPNAQSSQPSSNQPVNVTVDRRQLEEFQAQAVANKAALDAAKATEARLRAEAAQAQEDIQVLHRQRDAANAAAAAAEAGN
jgi:hypothetical protein